MNKTMTEGELAVAFPTTYKFFPVSLNPLRPTSRKISPRGKVTYRPYGDKPKAKRGRP